MNLILAFLKHAFYALDLKHDGTGLPTKFFSALMLISVYISLVFANNLATNTAISNDLLLGLVFISFVYLFPLRNQIIGLVLLIGIISNIFSLLLGLFGPLSELQVTLVTVMEYLMIFGALINIIKSNTRAV